MMTKFNLLKFKFWDLLRKFFFFLKPLQILYKEKTLFFIWFTLVFIGSSLGLVFSYLVSLDFSISLHNNLEKGNIYLISISLVAAFISDLLANLLLEYTEKQDHNSEKKDIWFINEKIILIILFIFLMAIMASIFTNIDNHNKINEYVIYDLQCIFYIISIMLGIYAFCLKHAKLHPEDFIVFQKKRTVMLENSDPHTDSEGNKL